MDVFVIKKLIVFVKDKNIKHIYIQIITKMSEHKPVSKIIGIQLCMLSPEEIRNNSVVNVTSRDTYVNNKPCVNGLFDGRMGVLEKSFICPTDGQNYLNCPGYFGHIELAKPVFFIQHLKEILKILRCICFKCSKLLINKNQHSHILKRSGENRWDYVYEIASNVKRCGEKTVDGCGCRQPSKISLEGMSNIFAIWEKIGEQKEDITIKLIPELVIKMFKRISDDDVYFMGFNPKWSRPEWMICTVLPIAPQSCRPSVKQDAQQRSEDDLTHIYSNIIKTNNILLEKIGGKDTPPNVIEGWTTILQHSVAMIANNKIKGIAPMAQRSGRTLKCIMDRINSKNGRIRGNLMGKRTDFSARSVITGDPNISICQLGVPMKIAKNLTKPVIVNDRNRHFLMKLIENGPEQYPGAKILEKNTGEQISLKYVDRKSVKLNNGDIVHRHLMDGDPVLFNRQPSLHRLSMLCHIVKVMKVGDTFRMNVANTKGYNADFDGDEMNAFVSQSVIADTELRHLAAIPYQQISPTNNSAIIGIFQDSLLGSYRFTRKNIVFTPRQAMNLLMSFNKINIDKLHSSGKKITSFDLLTQILPPLTIKRNTGLFQEGEDANTSNNVLEIKVGQYLRGQLDKGSLGSTTKGILQRIFNDFGPTKCAEFVDDLQNIVTEYMKVSSFSVGISDLIANKKTNDEIVQVINNQKMNVQKIIDKVHLGIFENNTAYSNINEFETMVNNTLNKATEESGKIGRKSLNKNNRFMMIVESGSKGSLINISQMLCCLGQQNVDGKRIPYGFDNRTLPHFTKYDDSPEARGFIENSFISGLTAPELFFHAMAGRIGLIDTAVKSVVSETPIVIIENDIPLYTEIGKWIDEKMKNAPAEKIQHFAEKNMELLNLDSRVYIPTTDEKGVVSWGELTAVTRHDPGERLYEIKTQGGRNVTVADSESLLVWREDTQEFLKIHSKDVKVNDFVPTCASMPSPPIVQTHIKLENYLSKKEYIYGTDFKKAIVLMNLEMKGKQKISSGWWNENNGNEFTLPYSKKSSLQRAITRSNCSVFLEEYVYPYHSSGKSNIHISNKFELNEENGIFVGLFLAEGHLSKNSISITNNDRNICDFVKKWFMKNGIYCKETVKINKVGWKTTTVRGFSSILTTLFKKLMNNGASNKQVPDEAFTAPDMFAIGLLNGYYSGDGSVSKNSIDVSSASTKLIDGISMLLSRFGIFGKRSISQLKTNNFGTKNIKPTYRLRICSHWGQLFADKIHLIEKNKQQKLKAIKWTHKHLNFATLNNVVLDKIVSINIIGTENHPKLYDVTVPSTLNFGIANGLMLRDTSSTGYIQRRLIKGLEDLKVEYDLTVRNSNGKIIQYAYGDDYFDSTKIENQVIPLTGMSIEDIYLHYDIPGINDTTTSTKDAIFTKQTITRMKTQKNETLAKSKSYIEKMLLARDDIVKKIFKNKNDNMVKTAVSFQSIISNIHGQLSLTKNSAVDISPLEAYELIESYYEKMNQMTFVKTNPLFEILYYYYLSPRDLLVFKRFHKKGLIWLLETVLLKFKESIVHPGEMVGVISGQGCGAEMTQLTLNTFHNTGTASKSNVTRGVPRIEEILRLTKNPKNMSMTVYLKPFEETNQTKAINYSNILEHTRFIDIVKSVQIYYDPNDNLSNIVEDRLFIEEFQEYERMMEECMKNGVGTNVEESLSEKDRFVKSKWVIRIEMNAETMLDKNITMDDVNFAITNSNYNKDVQCIYSDYNSDNLIFRLRVNNGIFSKIQKRKVAKSLDQSDEIYLLKNFQDSLLNNIVLRGISGIRNVLARKLQNMVVMEDDKYIRKDTWVLDTTGSNLLETLGLDFIDYRRTISNDIKEVFDILGIEAARQVIYNELTEVFEFSDIYINYHHTSLLCDRMTCNKNMVAIFRFKSGLLNEDTGPISKSTFEVHTEVLLNASRHGEFDNMRGVSANVMCGQYGNFGTSCFNVILDKNAFENAEDAEIVDNDVEKEIEQSFNLMRESTTQMDICNKNTLTIQNNIENIHGEGGRFENICDDNYDVGF